MDILEQAVEPFLRHIHFFLYGGKTGFFLEFMNSLISKYWCFVNFASLINDRTSSEFISVSRLSDSVEQSFKKLTADSYIFDRFA